ncbi:MAG: TetR family transcriptional regulator [Pseudomonadota bacterium]
MSDPIILSDRRARTRDQLLAAAQSLLAERPAGALGVRQITTAAGVPYSAFHSHYSSIEAMVEDLARLVFTSQTVLVERLRDSFAGPAEAFAAITRQTLRIVTDGPGYGQLLFDAGLPLDWFVAGMRQTLKADITAAEQWGVFRIENIDITVSLLAGAIAGAGLDLHRGVLDRSAIEPVTARLLEFLGVGERDAMRLAHADATFMPPPPLPLGWRDLAAIQRDEWGVA